MEYISKTNEEMIDIVNAYMKKVEAQMKTIEVVPEGEIFHWKVNVDWICSELLNTLMNDFPYKYSDSNITKKWLQMLRGKYHDNGDKLKHKIFEDAAWVIERICYLANYKDDDNIYTEWELYRKEIDNYVKE